MLFYIERSVPGDSLLPILSGRTSGSLTAFTQFGPAGVPICDVLCPFSKECNFFFLFIRSRLTNWVSLFTSLRGTSGFGVIPPRHLMVVRDCYRGPLILPFFFPETETNHESARDFVKKNAEFRDCAPCGFEGSLGLPCSLSFADSVYACVCFFMVPSDFLRLKYCGSSFPRPTVHRFLLFWPRLEAWAVGVLTVVFLSRLPHCGHFAD